MHLHPLLRAWLVLVQKSQGQSILTFPVKDVPEMPLTSTIRLYYAAAHDSYRSASALRSRLVSDSDGKFTPILLNSSSLIDPVRERERVVYEPHPLAENPLPLRGQKRNDPYGSPPPSPCFKTPLTLRFLAVYLASSTSYLGAERRKSRGILGNIDTEAVGD